MVKGLPIPMTRVRLSTRIALQDFLRKEKVEKKRKKKQRLSPKRVYTSYSEKQRLLVVGLRYGSGTDFTQIQRSWVEIEKLTRIPQSSAIEIVKTY